MVSLHRQLRWSSPLFYVALVGVAGLYGLALARLSLLNAFLLVFFSLVGLGTLIEPLVGLLASLFLGILWAWLRAELPAIPPLIAMPVLALTLSAWLARGVVRREIRLQSPSLLFPLVLFIAAAAFSFWDGIELQVYGLPELLKWLQILALFWLVVDYIDARRLPWLVGGLLLIGVFQAAVGLWQFGLRGTGPDHFAILDNGFYRAYGTFEQPNPYAGYLGLVFPLGVGIFANGLLARVVPTGRAVPMEPAGLSRNQSARVQLLGFGAVLLVIMLTGAALVVSWSRGAWLGMGAAVLVIFMALPRRSGLGVGLVVLLLVGTLGLNAFGLLPTSISARLTGFTEYARLEDVRGVAISEANYAVLERLAHWQAALDMWRANFWNGVGFGDYEPAYPDYALLNWPVPLGHAHNYYFNVAAETGFIGLAAYLLLWGAVFWQTWRVTRRAPVGLWWRGLAIGLLGSWTHLSIHHLFDNLYVNNVHLHFGVLLGLVALLTALTGAQRRVDGRGDLA